MTLSDLRSRVEKAKDKQIKGCDGFTCRCPSCAAGGSDKSGTNGYCYEKDDWLHPGCQAGCSQEDFMGALGLSDEDRRIVPLEERDAGSPRPKPSPKPAETTYKYTLPNGRVVFLKKRYYIQDPNKPEKGWFKQFSQMTPPSAEHPKGQKIEVLGSRAQILYNLVGIKRAKEQGLTVFVNEGEKAADRFNALGQVGTCTNNGGSAGEPSGKWTPSHTKQLIGVKRVVIVADLDEDEKGRNVGREYAMFVAGQIWDVVPDVSIVTPATKGKKDDAWDHFEAGHGIADFIPRPDWHPDEDETYAFGEEFQEREAEWLIPDFLPRKKCILLDATGGVGKTTLCAYVAAKLSRGEHPFEFQDYKPVMLECGPVKTLYLHKGEDEDGEIETVYRACGGVPGYLLYFKDPATLVLDDAGFARLRRAIFKNGARLVIMDALFYFLEGLIKSSNDADQVIPILQRLNDVARERDCTFLNCRHTKKLGGAAGAKVDPAELGMGTQMFRNKHRGQWVARKHPTKKGVVVVTNEKDSLLYLGFESFAYQRQGNEVFLRPNDADGFETDGQRLEKMSEISKAKDVIREVCLPGIPVLTSILNERAARENISAKTLNRARKAVGIKPYGKEKGTSDRPARNMIVLPLDGAQEVDPFYED